ncbi:hypothetical protein B0H14DRAFT_2654028 [Mycena olivaceomarginata]|nr:hypothetical protein B0H14DRAFT_2654028 [Mycena olivaceomarginata]
MSSRVAARARPTAVGSERAPGEGNRTYTHLERGGVWSALANSTKSLANSTSEIPIRDSMLQGIEKAGMNDCFERKEGLETDGILHMRVEKWCAGGQDIDEAV